LSKCVFCISHVIAFLAKLDKEAYLLNRKYLKQAQRELKQLEIERNEQAND
jgi:hypothetical protein